MSPGAVKTNHSLTMHIKVGCSDGGFAGCRPDLEQAPSSFGKTKSPAPSSDSPAGSGKLEEEAESLPALLDTATSESKVPAPVPDGPSGTEKGGMQDDPLGEPKQSSSVTSDIRATSIIVTEKGGRPVRTYRGAGPLPSQGGDLALFYLKQTFHYPVTLMSAMFDTGCVLTGSRALEFFLPGAAGPDSAWDFYVPGYKESVADMIDALARCGVIWHLEGDSIVRELAEKGCVTVSQKTLQAMASWKRYLSHEAGVDLMGKELCDIIEAFRSLKNDT